MTENICPHCRKPVPEAALGGICPDCMLKAGLASPTDTGAGPHGTKVISRPPSVEDITPLFPHLEIQECLGRGGMGAVYKTRQPRLNRIVALKILAREKQNDPRFTERFTREAQALARLNHQNIVTVYDFGEADGHCYLLMEFVDGLNLRQLMRSGKLSAEQALEIVPSICEALQFAHEQGIVHRDIKPENILLDKAGRVKIADFGIAKIINPLTRPSDTLSPSDGERGGVRGESLTQGQVIGTPHYMAPEQVEKPATVDHRADIFSLGVVFYEMLTGELPLGKFQPPSRKVQVDVRLDEVVLHALEKEPDRRYQHANEVKTDVETITASKSEIRNPKSDARNGAFPQTKWITGARWTARVFSVLLLLFYGVAIVAEGLPPLASQPEGVQLNFVALGLMLGGFIVGWKREGTAALLIASGWTLWQISEGGMRRNAFQTPLPVAALYAFCWWATHQRKTVPLVAGTAALATALGLGLLFVPTNVFVRGRIVDAASGLPLRDVELRLTPRAGQSASAAPNARSAQDGRYQLYVGWYWPEKQITLAAPGYATLTTNLGPRELGQRNISRDFSLSALTVSEASEKPSPETAAPVVVETFPVSGTKDVDPSITELRATFSKPMRGAAWCQTDEFAAPDVVGQPRYLDERTCVLPVRLERGHVYGLWLNTDSAMTFRDLHDRPAVPYLLIFETRK